MKRHLILHPLLFAVFPILFLFQYNKYQPVPLGQAVTLMAAAAALAALLWAGAFIVLREATRAAALASFLTLLLLSYGHLVLATNEFLRRRGVTLTLHADSLALLAPWLLVLGFGCWLIARKRRPLPDATRALDVTAAALVAASLVGTLVTASGVPVDAVTRTWDADVPGVTPEAPRNVYLVVLDGYASGHTLREAFGYDNAWFEDALRERGFHVANESRANYPRTFLSLASTLNMRYLDDLPVILGEDAVDKRLPYHLIGDNDVARFLKAHGYRYVHFNSGWLGTEWSPLADEVVQCGTKSEFERMLHRTTILTLLDSHLLREQHDRVRCQFDALEALPARLAASDAPAFVLAHIVSPHEPFVFDADGAFVDEVRVVASAKDPAAARHALYADQVAYVSARALAAVDAIIAADPDAVVIVQSDHGSDFLGDWEDPGDAFLRERTRNLNAMRLPGVDAPVAADVTNVNTFRIVLDAYFGTDVGLLEDRVFFSTHSAPYRFTDVTNVTAYP